MLSSYMASSRPHPYRYPPATFSSLEDNNIKINRTPIPQISLARDTNNTHTEKPLINAISRLQPQSLPHRAPSRHDHRSLPFLSPIFLLMFIPIPPLLSLLYLTTGHAILRQNHQSSIYHEPILLSIEAGATGGAILSLPITILLYLFMFSTRNSSSVPDDFFEDDDSTTTSSAHWLRYAGYVVCVIFLVGIGGVAGPLGVTCLSTHSTPTSKMLSTGAAALAGLLGGVILSVGILLLGLLTTLIWSFWVRQNRPSP